jgi:hypothetical protein
MNHELGQDNGNEQCLLPLELGTIGGKSARSVLTLTGKMRGTTFSRPLAQLRN